MNSSTIVSKFALVYIRYYTIAENTYVFIDNIAAAFDVFISSSCRPGLGLSLVILIVFNSLKIDVEL